MTTPLFFVDETHGHTSERTDDAEAIDKLRRSDAARHLLVCGMDIKAHANVPSRVAWLQAEDLPQVSDDACAVWLGVHEGVPRFAHVLLSRESMHRKARFGVCEREGFINLFQAARTASSSDALLAARAVHLGDWLMRTRYCGSCGAQFKLLAGGYKRVCANETCGREEFPRTDPVVIVLAACGDYCLLARQPSFPRGFYSPLSGFLEPGENLETAVRREISEEVGLAVTSLQYVASQPWPFPCSLMIGFVAEVPDRQLRVDHRELEDAVWCERREMESLVRPSATRTNDVWAVPPVGVLGRRLIDYWLQTREVA